jgi:hypothetical protein
VKFTYKGEVFEYDHLKMSTAEAEALKRYTGLTPREYFEGMANMDAAALRGMVWVALRRNGHGIQYKDIEFDVFEFAKNISNDEAPPDEEAKGDPPALDGPSGTPRWPGEPGI